MFFYLSPLAWVCFAFFFAGCSGSKTVYRHNEVNMASIKKEFIDKKRAVRLRFFVQKDLMYEETGYIISSPKEDYITFQYYEHKQRKFIDLDLPLKNISEISYKKGAFEFDQSAKNAGTIAIIVSVFIAIGIWTQ